MGQFDAVVGVMPAADQSWIANLLSLLLLPFAHEDLAIVLGSYFVVNETMPVAVVAGGLYTGMVASDFALYGLGACARRVPWLERYAINDRVQTFGSKLKRNIFLLVALCRVVPGIVFFAFVACGWSRVSLMRFSLASVVVSAIYLPLTLYAAIVFGDLLDDLVGLWTWPLLLAALVSTALFRNRIFGAGTEAGEAATDRGRAVHFEGMPSLASGQRHVAAAERIPPPLFYTPLVLNWIWLGIRHRSLTLPCVANPRILTGGMWGESKSGYFIALDAQQGGWIADFIVIRRGAAADIARDAAHAAAEMTAAGFGFPIVAKPDIGWHGYGVQRIETMAALHAYLAAFPFGTSLILQRFVPYAGEAAILYARMPGQARGRIESLTLRYFPHVVGNGSATVGELIRKDARACWKARLHLGADPSHCGACDLERVPAEGEVVQIALIGNQRAGGLYRDVRHHITSQLEARIDGIARGMPDFHYGRFDLRFKSVEALRRGEDFSIVEINGAGGEAIDAWDPSLPVAETYRRLFAQQRLLFAIGGSNRARGVRPPALAEFIAPLFRQTELIRKYPPSH